MSSSSGWIKTESPSGTGYLLRKGTGEKIPKVHYALDIYLRKVPDQPDQYKTTGKIQFPDAPGFILRNLQKHFKLCLEDGRKIADITLDHGDGTVSGTVGEDFY